MILHVHDNLRISDIQERFSECFQWLKIEFYSKPLPTPVKKYLISPGKTIGQIRTSLNEGNLEIKSWYTVAMVQKDLKEKFGLNAFVFFKENGEWLETSRMKKHTLLQLAGTTSRPETPVFNVSVTELDEYDYL